MIARVKAGRAVLDWPVPEPPTAVANTLRWVSDWAVLGGPARRPLRSRVSFSSARVSEAKEKTSEGGAQ